MTTPTAKPCRHRRYWVYAYNEHRILWCYECGAIRRLYDDKRWTRPVGPGGQNPAMRCKGAK